MHGENSTRKQAQTPGISSQWSCMHSFSQQWFVTPLWSVTKQASSPKPWYTGFLMWGRVCPIRYGITHTTDLSRLNSNQQRSNWYIIAQGLKHAKTGIQHKSHWFSQSNTVWPKASGIPRTLVRQSIPKAQRLSPRSQSRTSSKNKPFFWMCRVWVIQAY